MGAWIEINTVRLVYTLCFVAPYMGAWIEIRQVYRHDSLRFASHPTWVRGLKFARNG
mgnify:CR=1 FL=1